MIEIENLLYLPESDKQIVSVGFSKKESKNMSLKIIDMGYSLVYDFGLYKDWK